MADQKNINARLRQKYDTSENWKKAGDNGFIPLKGEIIVYSDLDKIKIGDGVTNVNQIFFLSSVIIITFDIINKTSSHSVYEINKYIRANKVVMAGDGSNYYYLSQLTDETAVFTALQQNLNNIVGYEIIEDGTIRPIKLSIPQSDWMEIDNKVNSFIQNKPAIKVGAGTDSIVEGGALGADGDYAHAEGYEAQAGGFSAHAEGNLTRAEGDCSHAEGYESQALGLFSHAEGECAMALGNDSHAEGDSTYAIGDFSHSEGEYGQAVGNCSHVEGYKTYAFGIGAHAEGKYEFTPQNWRLSTTDPDRKVWKYGARGTATVGDYVKYDNVFLKIVAITPSAYTITLSDSVPGSSTQNVVFEYYGKIGACGDYSHTEGGNTNAIGSYSHTEGLGTIASTEAQHVQGKYNTKDENQAHILGWGTSPSESDRQNIHTISTTGEARFAGNIYVNCEGQTLQENAKQVATQEYVNNKTYAITAEAEDDGVVVLSGTEGNNSVSYSASHAKQGPESGYTSGNETTNIGAEGGIIKIPQFSVDTYGHVTAATDEDVTINWPDLSGYKTVQEPVSSPTDDGSASAFIDTITQDSNGKITATKKNVIIDWDKIITGKPSIKAGSGYGSIIENDLNGNTASGKWSHAEGQTTQATGDHCHAEGGETKASHHCAHAEGHGSYAVNEAAHAEGYETYASGHSSHSEGESTKASGSQSHAEGYCTEASGHYSHAQNEKTKAKGKGSHAEGYLTTTHGKYSHAEGFGRTIDNIHPLIIKKTDNSYAYHIGMGQTTYSVANKSGDNNYGFTQDANGYFCSNNTNIPSSYALCQVNINAPKDDIIYFHVVSSAETADKVYFSAIDSTFSSSSNYESSFYDTVGGINDKFISYAVSAGTHTIDIKFRKDSTVDVGEDQVKFAIVSSGISEDMIGKILRANNGKVACITEVNTSEHIITMSSALLASNENITYAYFISGAIGEASHLEGYHTDTIGKYSHAEGTETLANGIASHAEGTNTQALGDYSHSEGYQTVARAEYSHAEGKETNALGEGAHVEGYRTYATGAYSHVEGRYNEIDQKGTYAHIIGGGTSPSDRKNIHTVDWSGNAVYTGMMTANGGLTLASGSGYGQDIPENADEGRIFFVPDNTVDYIVECGERSIEQTNWYFERYDSGIVKMWGKFSRTLLIDNFQDSTGGEYSKYVSTLTLNLPVTLSKKFIETPNIINESGFNLLVLKKNAETKPSLSSTSTYTLGCYGELNEDLSIVINWFILGIA